MEIDLFQLLFNRKVTYYVLYMIIRNFNNAVNVYTEFPFASLTVVDRDDRWGEGRPSTVYECEYFSLTQIKRSSCISYIFPHHKFLFSYISDYT